MSDEPSEPPDNIVPLRPGTVSPDLPQVPFELGGISFQERRKGIRLADEPEPCKHMHQTLDEETHSLVCDDCQTQLDMYAAMLHFVRYWADAKARRDEAYASVQVAEERLRRAREDARAAEEKARELEERVARLNREAKYAGPPIVEMPKKLRKPRLEDPALEKP